MQNNKILILCTKPAGEALINEAAEKDIIIDEISFIRTEEKMGEKDLKKIKAFAGKRINAVFTSMNAAESVGKIISDFSGWEIFCTGSATAKIIREKFPGGHITATADNAAALADKITADPAVKKVRFFCGDHRRDELPVKLHLQGIEVEEIVVYRTIETPRIITKKYQGILFFSPSAVRSFFSKNPADNETRLFATGNTTASAIRKITANPVIIADQPGKETLVHLAIQYFSKRKND